MEDFQILALDIGASSLKLARFQISTRDSGLPHLRAVGGRGVRPEVFVLPQDSASPRLLGDVTTVSAPPWDTFERWVSHQGMHRGVAFVAVSCAGFIDSMRGEVRLFRAAGWKGRNLAASLGSALGVPVRILLNDAEAHLLAHMNPMQTFPLLGVALGTCPGIALATDSWTLFRPRQDSNMDLGAMRFPTRAGQDRVWWSLGSHGLDELCNSMGPDGGVRHYGYRLGAFLATLCSVFQPRAVVLSGGLAERHYRTFSATMESEFSAQKPDWLELPRFELSPYGRSAGLWGLANAACAGWG